MPILVTWIIPVTCLCIHNYRSKVQPQDILLHQASANMFGQLCHVVYFCGWLKIAIRMSAMNFIILRHKV